MTAGATIYLRIFDLNGSRDDRYGLVAHEAAGREYAQRQRRLVANVYFDAINDTWKYHQDFSECRAAFEIQGSYAQDVASWNVRLPFWKWSRVPEIALEHPEVVLHSLGQGRVLGTVTG